MTQLQIFNFICANDSYVADNSSEVLRNNFTQYSFIETMFTRCLIYCFLCLPVNLYIAIVIISSPHLYQRPHNIFHLNLIFCNIFNLLAIILETINLINPGNLLCDMIVFIDSLPSLLFYFNLFLALIDQYFVITQTDYREMFTVYRIAICTPIFNLVMASILKWVFIGRWTPASCAFNIAHTATLCTFLFIIFVSCLILNIILERKQPEIEETRALIRNAAALLLLPIPLLVFTIFDYLLICLTAQDSDCISTFFSLVPFLKMVTELHSFVHPALFLYKNNEFFLQ